MPYRREVCGGGLSLLVEASLLPPPGTRPPETEDSFPGDRIQLFVQPWLPTSGVSSPAAVACSPPAVSTRSPECGSIASEPDGFLQTKEGLTVPSSLDDLMAVEVAAEASVTRRQHHGAADEARADLLRDLFEQKERELLQQIG